RSFAQFRTTKRPTPARRLLATAIRPAASRQATRITRKVLRRRYVQKSLHIDPDKCTGCLQCEMACSYEAYGVFNPSRSRIKVFDFHATGRKVPYTCTQCDEAWCMKACPVDAIRVDADTGAKMVLHDVCVGCK